VISEKYMAGFIDADGHISIRARLNASPDLEVSVGQSRKGEHVLLAIQEMFGGSIREKWEGKHLELQLRGKTARKLLERLSKYMVLKRHHAERMIEVVDNKTILRTVDEVRAVRQEVKQIRAFGASGMPNYPSRKWLAGYFDGDGSFSVSVDRYGRARPNAAILAAKNYVVGISLICSTLGGRINAVGENAVWQLGLDIPSKAIQFLSFFAQHLEIKKAQAYFLLGCAQNGNFRDGKAISTTIKTLNAQQHRLSDPTSVAADYVKQVDFSIPPAKLGRPKGVKDTRPRKKRQSETYEAQPAL